MSEAMPPVAELDEVCELITDGTHYSPPTSVAGPFRYITSKNIRTGRVDLSDVCYVDGDTHAKIYEGCPVRRGDVLFVKDGVNTGTAAINTLNEPFSMLSSVALIRTQKDRLNSGYLVHWLNSPVGRARMMRNMSGCAIRRLVLREIRKAAIPIPPLSQQRRIAETLDLAEALRAKRRAALAQLDTLRQSVFLDLFGDPATNSKGWPTRTIYELCEVKGGKRLPKGEEYSPVPTPFRYIRVTDIKEGVVDERALVYLKPEVQAKIARYIVNAGDVIISIAGSIGLIAPVPPSLEGVNLTENAARLVPKDRDAYDANYLSAVLRTPVVQSQIGSHIGQVTIGKLALFRVEKVRVPLPPISLQREFARRVGEVARLRVLYGRSMSEVDTLFAALQHYAFQGQL